MIRSRSGWRADSTSLEPHDGHSYAGFASQSPVSHSSASLYEVPFRNTARDVLEKTIETFKLKSGNFNIVVLSLLSRDHESVCASQRVIREAVNKLNGCIGIDFLEHSQFAVVGHVYFSDFFSARQAEGALKAKVKAKESLLLTSIAISLVTNVGVESVVLARLIAEARQTAVNTIDSSVKRIRQHLAAKLNSILNNDEFAADKVEEVTNTITVFEQDCLAGKVRLNGITSNDENAIQTINTIVTSLGQSERQALLGLPIYPYKEEIVNLVRDNQVSVFVAETGSGKSTQIVQYLHSSGLFSGKIACTQPRRLAARSLSEYVAKQVGCKNGGLVASMVGGKPVSKETKIAYMTDFQLLKLCVSDPSLSDYDCIIVDEAHERNLHTDLIIGLLKQALQLRPQLKVLITSATINPNLFLNFFADFSTAHAKIPGRVYRVDVHYSDEKMDKSEKYYERAVDKVLSLCNDPKVPAGNMLVFLTTPKDTENASSLFARKWSGPDKVSAYPLHGQLQPEDQRLAMEEVKTKNERKIIFSTNCAETSLTIPGVVVVVDSGLSKQNAFDPVRNMDALVVGEISRNSADQRKGRAGRTQNGCCYRLYTEADYNAMNESTVPEIQRIDLAGVAIRILELGLNPLRFDYLTPPSKDGLNSAMTTLQLIGAVSDDRLTELGNRIAKIPAEPRLAKLILLCCEKNLAMEGIVLASLMSLSGQVFFRGKTESERLDAMKTKEFYASDEGDLITSMQVFKDWLSQAECKRTKWSVKNCVNNKSMRSVNEKVSDVQRALKYDLKMNFSDSFSSESSVVSAVQECIYRVFSDKLCVYSGNSRIGFVEISTGQRLKIHPSSVFINSINFSFAVYTKLLETEETYLLNITPVSSELLSNKILESEIVFKTISRIMPVSTEVLKRLVGRGRTAAKQLEENVKKNIRPSVFEIYCNFELHSVDLVCEPASCMAAAKALTKESIESVVSTLCSHERLAPDQTQLACTIHLAQGFVISQLHLPGESSAVKLQSRNPDDPVSIAMLKAVSLKYKDRIGPIEVNERGKFLITESPVSAQKLVEILNSSEISIVALIKSQNSANGPEKQVCDMNELKLRLTFPRRYPTGLATVSFENPGDAARLFDKVKSLQFTDFWSSRIAINKRDSEQLVVFDVPLWLEGSEIERRLNLESGSLSSVKPTVLLRRENLDNALSKEAAHNRVNNILNAVFGSQFVEDKENYQFAIRDPPNPGFYDWQVTVCFKFDEDYVSFAKEFRRFKTSSLANLQLSPYVSHGRVRKALFLEKQHSFKNSAFSATTFAMLFPPLIVSREIFAASESSVLEVKKDIEKRTRLFPPEIRSMLLRNPVTVAVDSDYTEKQRGIEVKKIKIDVKTEDLTAWSFAYQHLRKALKPYELDCSRNEALRSLLLTRSEAELRKRLPKTAHAIFDRRRECLSIYGPEAVQSQCQIVINGYLTERESLTQREILLTGGQRPRGLIRRLLKTFGRDLAKLGDGSVTAELDIGPSRSLTLFGQDAAAVANAAKAVEHLAEEEAAGVAAAALKNSAAAVLVPGTVDLECPVCFASASNDLSSANCTLTICGHVYCPECLDLQLASATGVPLVCAAESCGRPLHVNRDVLARAPEAERDQMLRRLLALAVKDHVARPSSCLQFCPAPDCPGLLRDFKQTAVRESRCRMCRGTFCLDCRDFSHVGLSCQTAKEIKANPDYGLQTWLKADSRNRKQCPKCRTHIEKNAGCNHMTCISCHCHFCWICLKSFATAGEVYNHQAFCR